MGGEKKLIQTVKGLPEWEKKDISEKSSEYMFFTDQARSVLFKNVYVFTPLNGTAFEFKGHKWCIAQTELHVFSDNIGALVFDVTSAENTFGIPLTTYLDFTELFRYTGDIYEGHSNGRRGLFIDTPEFQIDDGLTEGLVSYILDPLFESGREGYERLFDERMLSLVFYHFENHPDDDQTYKIINIDSAEMALPSEEHLNTFMQKNTYRRWTGTGVIYGFTHFSFATLLWNNESPWLTEIFRNQYKDLALFLAYHYGALMNFDKALMGCEFEKNKVDKIFTDYARYIKDYKSPIDQDQGRELYYQWLSIIEGEYKQQEMLEYKKEVLSGKSDVAGFDLSEVPVLRYSTVFLYPFYYSPDKNTVLKKLTEENGQWEVQKFKFEGESKEESEKYSEYVYFYPYVREILFSDKDKASDRPSVYLRYRLPGDAKLVVTYPDTWDSLGEFIEISGDQHSVEYPIDSIQAHIFEFGIGILAIQVADDCFSYRKKQFKEILCFNEIARKIAPSFDVNDQKKAGLLPDAIMIKNLEGTREGFSKESRVIKDGTGYVSNVIKSLLMPLESGNILDPKTGNMQKDKGLFQTVLDERMVVYSYVCLDNGKLSANRFSSANKDMLRFTFVDKWRDDSFCNDTMVEQHVKNHIYDNWLGAGTRYGFTRYSGALITTESLAKICEESSRSESFGFTSLYDHFETIYYEIALLLFFQRASLISFSHQATLMASNFAKNVEMPKSKEKEENLENLLKELLDLRAKFVLFNNKYWFSEITNLDQGIDIFDKWEGCLRNKTLFEEVNQEIKELTDYVSYIQERNEADQAKKLNALILKLTIIATAGLILTVWFGYFGMSIIDETSCDAVFWRFAMFWAAIGFTLSSIGIAIRALFQSKRSD